MRTPPAVKAVRKMIEALRPLTPEEREMVLKMALARVEAALLGAELVRIAAENR